MKEWNRTLSLQLQWRKPVGFFKRTRRLSWRSSLDTHSSLILLHLSHLCNRPPPCFFHRFPDSLAPVSSLPVWSCFPPHVRSSCSANIPHDTNILPIDSCHTWSCDHPQLLSSMIVYILNCISTFSRSQLCAFILFGGGLRSTGFEGGGALWPWC